MDRGRFIQSLSALVVPSGIPTESISDYATTLPGPTARKARYFAPNDIDQGQMNPKRTAFTLLTTIYHFKGVLG